MKEKEKGEGERERGKEKGERGDIEKEREHMLIATTGSDLMEIIFFFSNFHCSLSLL